MKSVIFATVVMALGIPLEAGAAILDCPSVGTYLALHIEDPYETVTNVTSWDECGKAVVGNRPKERAKVIFHSGTLCTLTGFCEIWTWEESSFNCSLQTFYDYKPEAYTSGQVGCTEAGSVPPITLDCPSYNTSMIDYFDYLPSYVYDVLSWEDCGEFLCHNNISFHRLNGLKFH